MLSDVGNVSVVDPSKPNTTNLTENVNIMNLNRFWVRNKYGVRLDKVANCSVRVITY